MGEILSFMGRHEEAVGWVEKSMKLNPYHPERYWTHLARPLFHLGLYEETLTALEHIARPWKDDHTYRLAACAKLGDIQRLKQYQSEMTKAYPELDPYTFVETFPYENDSDRQTITDALSTIKN